VLDVFQVREIPKATSTLGPNDSAISSDGSDCLKVDSHVEHVESKSDARPPRARLISSDTLPGVIKAIDFATVLICGAASYFFYFLIIVGHQEPGSIGRHGFTNVLGVIIFMAGFDRIGGYKFEQLSRLRWQITHITLIWFCALSVFLVIAFVTKTSELYSRGWAIIWTASTLGFLFLQRAVLQSAMRRWSRNGAFLCSVVIVGAGEPGAKLIQRLGKNVGQSRVAVLGVFDDRQTRVAIGAQDHRMLGTTDDLLQYVRHTPVDEVIIALPLSAEQRVKAIVEKLKALPVDLRLSAEQLGEICPIRRLDRDLGVLVLDLVERPLKNWNGFAKWIEDKLLSTILLALFAPIMILISIAIKFDSAGPVLFHQRRYGYNNKIIIVNKFRTLRAEATDDNASKLVTRDDDRLTRIGYFLRRFSLDELPQLLNVINGEMSIVGPRPHATQAKAGSQLYEEAVGTYMARHRVKPGLTGWAQVNGWRGQTLTTEQIQKRTEHDLYYIEHWSVWFDLWIIIKTGLAIFQQENAF
jgi:Undecaprenyl-phosphate glucose phosphotransferase